MPALQAVNGPAGWQPADFNEIRVWVPPTWAVDSPSSGGCSDSGQDILLVATNTVTFSCPLVTPGATATVLPGIALPPGTPTRTTVLNGLRALSPVSQPAGRHVVAFPELDATVTIPDGAPPGLLASIGPSPEGLVLASGPVTPPPSDWRTVSYHGVQLNVPGSWPSIDGNHGGPCGNFLNPEVLVGPNTLNVASCPAVPEGQQHGEDGLWLTPAAGGTLPTRTIPAPIGGTMVTDAANTTPMIDLVYQVVSIQLGMGPDPAIARTIFRSIRFDGSSPDTAVEGFCPTWVPSQMPLPERLASTLKLEDGTVTLDPPAAGDQPALTAKQAWSHVTQPEPGATYRLILSRYSSAFPATLSNGTFTPVDQNELAWVIYGVPSHTVVGDCGRYELSGYNAMTGAPVGAQSTYGPGP